jgi:hypothetical protein
LSARDRNKKVFIGIRGRPVREAGNITAIWAYILQTYRTPQPVTDIALLFFYFSFTLLLSPQKQRHIKNTAVELTS